MRLRISLFPLLLIFTTLAYAQTERPKLVVGIVVDQMRYEYLTRFDSKYGNEGFKRLLSEGFNLRNAHYNYAPTYTGPGHASVYTGTTPAYHGIIANDWYDKEKKEFVYCSEDPSVRPVGAEAGIGVSPVRMLATTVTDELRIFSQYKSKVIGVSAKDRGAALPAGHVANAAYWYDKTSGNFVSSTFYMEELPTWVEKFNKRELASDLLNQTWNTLLPIEEYTESGPDNDPNENKAPTKRTAEFPYDLKAIKEKTGSGFSFLIGTPFGNTMVTEMAIAAIEGEKLGQGTFTDMLTVSYSSPDYVGHAFGPNSVELEDTYIRLDTEFANLLKALDKNVGKGNYTVFLTADHAVVDIPASAKEKKLPAGYLTSKEMMQQITSKLNEKYGEGEWVESVDNMQVFLNHSLIEEQGKDLFAIRKDVVNELMTLNGMANAYTSQQILNGDYNEGGTKGAIIRGFNQKRSGDVAFMLNPGWLPSSGGGSAASHGSAYTYDTHVPMVFYGWGIKPGSSVKYHPITDIAPTISTLLNIKFPSACTGQPISEIFE